MSLHAAFEKQSIEQQQNHEPKAAQQRRTPKPPREKRFESRPRFGVRQCSAAFNFSKLAVTRLV
jgi:hypothetical protein